MSAKGEGEKNFCWNCGRYGGQPCINKCPRKPAPVESVTQDWEEFIEKHRRMMWDDETASGSRDVIYVDDLRARLASLPAAVPSVPVSQLHSLLANWKLAMFQLDGKAMVAVRECINDLHEVVDLHAGKP